MSSEARKQTSFRLEDRLLVEVQQVAIRTGRTPRQVVEMALERILPLIESGFCDSAEANKLLATMEDGRQRIDALLSKMEERVRLERGFSEQPRTLAVFRLDPELLAKVRKVAEQTGRNDRQVLELCLRWGVPMAEVWMQMGPVLEKLQADWVQFCKDMAQGPGSLQTQSDWRKKTSDALGRMAAAAILGITGEPITQRKLAELRKAFESEMPR